MNASINIKITRCEYDLYKVDRDLVDMFPDRTCFGCGKRFKVGDMASVAFTDRGNKLFHTGCLRAAMKSEKSDKPG